MSQTNLMLKLLRKAGQKGVPNYTFPAHRILRYSARINDLRKEGYDILCERLRLPSGRATNVFVYTLVEEPEENWFKSLWKKK